MKDKSNKMDTASTYEEEYLEYSYSSCSNIPTKNQFDVLIDDDPANSISSNNTIKKTVRYCPPITVKYINYAKVRQLLTDAKVPDGKCRIKLAGIGVRIQCQETVHHNSIIDYCTNRNYEFFTFQLPDSRTTNFTLSGLFAMDITELKTELQNSILLTIVEIKKTYNQK